MSNTGRVDKSLFSGDHYLGKPAGDEDKIISRRINILERYPEFFNQSLSCIEAGCGSGATITRIANRFNKSAGIDIFDYSAPFEVNRRRNGAINCEFRQLDTERELPPEQFDRLISFEVIEHLKSEDAIGSYNDQPSYHFNAFHQLLPIDFDRMYSILCECIIHFTPVDFRSIHANHA